MTIILGSLIAAAIIVYLMKDGPELHSEGVEPFQLEADTICTGCGKVKGEYLWHDGAHLCDACDEKRMESN